MAEDDAVVGFPPTFDPIYFMDGTWQVRLDHWLVGAAQQGFSLGNHAVVEQALKEPEAGLRVVINISSAALLASSGATATLTCTRNRSLVV